MRVRTRVCCRLLEPCRPRGVSSVWYCLASAQSLRNYCICPGYPGSKHSLVYIYMLTRCRFAIRYCPLLCVVIFGLYTITGRDIPIVHRVMKLHQETGTGAIKFLTKGDNNFVDDRGLYAPGQMWLQPSDVVGRARAFIPHIGIVTILMNDYPAAKYALLGVLGLFVLLHRE